MLCSCQAALRRAPSDTRSTSPQVSTNRPTRILVAQVVLMYCRTRILVARVVLTAHLVLPDAAH
eukprot:1670355-Rhodomonas_salina.4